MSYSGWSVEQRLGLDLDLVVADQGGNLDEAVGGTGRSEIPPMDLRDRFAVRGVGEVDAGAHDVGRAAAERGDAGRDLVEDVDRLAGGVAAAHHLALAMGRRGAADQDAPADPHRP